MTTKKKDLDNILEIYLSVRPRLDAKTMFKVRTWERFQFLIDNEHKQHKGILQRPLPDALKMSIARRIENNLFSKVMVRFCLTIHVVCTSDRCLCEF
jgi:hypothetical protein